MKRLGNNLLLGLLGAAALAGCGSSSVNHGTGGTSGGGTGGSGTGNVTEVLITPDNTGWVDMAADGNTLGIQGAWYGYGDQYGEMCADPKYSGMKCNDPAVGNHPTGDCSKINTPTVPAGSDGFPPMSGKGMCTSGTVAKVANIINAAVGAVGTPDYSNVWGAGIGLDLAAAKAASACDTKGTFPATDKHVIGIKFDIDMVPAVGLRVEFPIPATDGTKNGSDYWGGDASYTNSPVMMGTNTIYFADPTTLASMTPPLKGVTPPGSAPTVPFDANKIESVQFHVPAGTSSAYPAPYSFCINNLKFLVQQ